MRINLDSLSLLKDCRKLLSQWEDVRESKVVGVRHDQDEVNPSHSGGVGVNRGSTVAVSWHTSSAPLSHSPAARQVKRRVWESDMGTLGLAWSEMEALSNHQVKTTSMDYLTSI